MSGFSEIFERWFQPYGWPTRVLKNNAKQIRSLNVQESSKKLKKNSSKLYKKFLQAHPLMTSKDQTPKDSVPRKLMTQTMNLNFLWLINLIYEKID